MTRKTDNLEYLLSRYADEDLTAEQKRQIEQLGATDDAARQTLQSYEKLDACLAQLPALADLDRIDAGAFVQDVNSQIDASVSRRPRLAWRYWASLAAAAAIMFAIAWPGLSNRPTVPTQPATQPVHNAARLLNGSATLVAQAQPAIAEVRLMTTPSSRAARVEARASFVSLRTDSNRDTPAEGNQGEVVCYVVPQAAQPQPQRHESMYGFAM